jgi:hypothetical protein
LDLDGKKILGGFHWKLAIPQKLDGGIQMDEGLYFEIVAIIYIQLAPDSILCDSFGVAVRVASPAVQGIVVTRGMALAFWMYM